MMPTADVGTAADLIRAVHSGEITPLMAVDDAIARANVSQHLGAIEQLFAEEARGEAELLGARRDLAALPLAGLPVLIKDNIPVAGHPSRVGSRATDDAPATADHEVVRRLRAAGAVVLGFTRVPELCVFGTTDNANGITRNPWNPARTAGGSSGGSASAVAAGIVPVAHAADGMGSIRIPAAANGVIGIKPGRGVVAADMGVDSWGGMSENGVIARSVADAARVLAVMAGDPELAEPGDPGTLSITVASNTPSFLVSLDREWRAALERTAGALAAAGHTVTEAKFPYPANPIPLFARWWSGVATDAGELPFEKLEPRVQAHVRMGRRAQGRGWVKDSDERLAREAAEAHLAGHDILLTPMLARGVPEAAAWRERSWLANSWSNLRYAPYAALWNMLGWPAASVPAGLDRNGMPLAVQLVARPGGEALLLQVAAQVQRVQPWPTAA